MNRVQLVINETPLYKLKTNNNSNNFYIKREDMTGLAFGGNKARIIECYMNEIIEGDYDYIVTYGSSLSNHCRITASAASIHGLPCMLIFGETESESNNKNLFLYNLFDAKVVYSEIDKVSETIDKQMKKLASDGYKPYFIPGGGHGICGTHAYIQVYNEIQKQKNELNISFDYIFLASGTGTTQSGIIIGNSINKNDSEKIIGISIARDERKGKEEINKSIKDYLKEFNLNYNISEKHVNFIDDYVCNGYGKFNQDILDTIKKIAKKEGVMLDPVYTGKAFWGMYNYIQKNSIKGKNILFIHTGGIPLLFNYSSKF